MSVYHRRQNRSRSNCQSVRKAPNTQEGDFGLDTSRVHVIERITAQPERIEELKRALQQAAEYTKHIPGVRQLELLQNRQNPAEFIFFVIVDDLKQADDMLNKATWHQRLVGELPRLITGVPEWVVGSKIA